MTCRINLFVALSLSAATLLLTPPAIAREPIVIQNYPSGEHIYRVEIRNLRRFEVLEAGDLDGVGELHELVVQLRASNPDYKTQYDGFKLTGTELYLLNNSGILGGRRNMPIRVGQHITATPPGVGSGQTQMWLHVYSNPDDASYYNAGGVTLEIHALELDCAGNRVCRRNSQGSTSISFKIPEFRAPPPRTCGPTNTFRLEPLDGELQISGLSGTSINTHTYSSTWYLGVNHKKGGPRLQPFNADICIARTTREP